MIKHLRTLTTVLLVLTASICYGQIPIISYQTPQIYKVGIAISPLPPISTGGAVTSDILDVATGFSNPTAVAVDAPGNIYVVANGSNTVVKMTATGTGQTNIGSGFVKPTGVAVDAAGNVYVADFGDNAIKKIPVGGGVVTTVGSGFNNPYGIAIDKNGMLYISDRGNNVIKKVPSTGGTPVIIGTGFNTPTGIAVDDAGNVYVADRANNLIKKITAGTGTIVTLGSGNGNPNGVAVDADGNVYYADTNNISIIELPAGGGSPVILGNQFYLPAGLAITGNKVIYVDDAGSGSIYAFIKGGYSISKNLPAGLMFDTSTGVISGTPAAVSPATDYIVTATNVHGSATTTVNIRVKLPVAPAISYKTPQVYAYNVPITPLDPVNKGGAINAGGYHISPALPQGLFFDSNTGEIGGTPIAPSPATDYTISATNAGGTGTAVLNLTVTPPPKPAISYTSPQVYIAGTPVSQLYPTNTGGDITFGSFTISPGLPQGLSFSNFDGSIYGTPTAASPSTDYTISASNTGGTGTTILNITVNLPAKPVISYNTPNVYPVKAAISPLVPNVSGGQTAQGGFGITPNLPAGLSFDVNTGIISGTPSAASAAANYTVTATNLGGTGSATVNIKVVQPPSPVVNYSTPKVYTAGTAIDPLTPTSTGVGPLGNDDSTPIASGLDILRGVAVDNGGNVYVAQLQLGSVKKIFANGSASRVVASGLASPAGLASDASGNIYITENTGNTVLKLPVNGGNPVAVATAQNAPYAIAVDTHDNIFFTNMGDGSVREIPAGGGSVITLPQIFDGPSGIAVDAAGNIYISERNTNLIKEIPAGSNSAITIGSAFGNPNGVAVDANGNIYFVDLTSNSIGVFYKGIGTAVSVGFGLSTPVWLSMDGKNNIYVSDFDTQSVRKLTPLGGYFITPTLPAGLNLDQNTGTISGTPVAASPATTYTVTAYNTGGPVTAYVNIKVLPTLMLSNLTISSGTLTPTFASSNTVYMAAVDNTVAAVTLKPTAANATSTITVNGAAVTSGASSQSIPLTTAKTTVTIVVTSGDGLTIQPYTVVVSKGLSTNATLTSLKLNNGIDLSPAFSAGIARYTASVTADVTSVSVTPACTENDALIKVNDIPVQSGATSDPISLKTGVNVITTIVLAPNGVATRSYTITITRAQSSNSSLASLSLSSGTLSPVFDSNTLNYTAAVSFTSTAVSITPAAVDAGAQIKVNGTAVATGSPSAAIPLAVGANTINTIVTSQDGTTTKTYKVTVTRATPSANAILSSLALNNGLTLTPSFSAGTARYTANAANAVTSVNITPTVADATATVKVNGVAVASGSPSGNIPLAVGSNVITTTVTAQNGTSIRTYTVTITRAPSVNADLTGLAFNAGTLTPEFNTATFTYSNPVPFAVALIQLTPTAADATAKIKVNGAVVASGSPSANLPLAVGSNTITTVVTAQDGTTTKTYTVTVTRAAPSTNAVLTSLVLNGGTLSPSFSAGIARYTSTVPNSTSSVTVRPTAANLQAVITINGTYVPPGTTSGSIALNVGANTITTLVTAEDGLTKRTYTITVTRSAPGAKVLAADGSDNTITADGIAVHQSLSPNGDGNNDVLLIDGVSNFPDNNLVIFDRSGGVVYEAKGYNNGTIAFDGQSNKTGKLQPAGTYFYSFDYQAGDVKKHKTGYILLKY